MPSFLYDADALEATVLRSNISIDHHVMRAIELQDEREDQMQSPPPPSFTPPPSPFSSPLSSLPPSPSPSPPLPLPSTATPKSNPNYSRRHAKMGRTLRRRRKRAALKAELYSQDSYYVSETRSSISQKLPQPRRLRASETAPNILPSTLGGYTAPHRPSGKVHTLSELLEKGFRLLEWDGR
jgi:hypothetical protein